MSAGHRNLQPDTKIAPTVTGMMAQRELTIGEVVGGRFRVDRILGMGGMGLVYQAHDNELDIDVALKLLRPELASRSDAFERFRKELLLARQVSSPHVVRIHDLVRHEQAWLISMDYVAGSSLERELVEHKVFDPERALQVTRQLALGLAAAHRSNVVHRDLKPANVLVDEHGDVKITDFGVARSAGETGITGSGVVIGTPEYLSPEQAKAEPLDGRSDLYALGLILFEMLTGTLPFREGTPAEMLVQRIVRDPPPADSVRPGLPRFAVQLCARLLELRVSRRIQTAEEVVQAIDSRAVPGQPLTDRAAFRALAGLAMVMLIAGSGYLGWQAWRGAPSVTVEQAQALQLDLLPLPWASDDDADSQALAAGIRWVLADRLSMNPAISSADALRVDRALKELDYDALAADRQHPRVLEVMNARLVLEGDVHRQGEGWVLRMRLANRGSDTPQWSSEARAEELDQVPAALRSLGEQLHLALQLPPQSFDWPEASAIQTLGRWSAGETPVGEAAPEYADPALAWLRLFQLDRAGMSSEASAEAKRVSDALGEQHTAASMRARGLALTLLGELAPAQALVSNVVAAAPNDHPSRLLLARIESEQGDFAAAISGLQSLVLEDPRNVDAWYSLGRYSIQSGDAKSAVDDYLVRAQVLANRLDDRHMQAEVNHALGVGYRRLGQMEAAAERLRQAISQRHDLGEARGEAVSLQNLAMVLSMQGQFEPAERALTEAQEITRGLGDSLALANLSNAQGTLAEERGDYRAALAAFRDSLRLRQSLGDERSVGESLNNVGFAYYQLGEFDNAQTYWQQSAATFAGIDDRAGAVHAQQSLALAEIARGDWPTARQLLSESQRTAESLQMAEERAISLATLADLNRLEGRIGEALSNTSTAMAEFQRRSDPRGVVEMQLMQVAIAADLGDWAVAREALSALSSDEVQEQATVLSWRRAAVLLGSGELAPALDAADSAIEQAANARSYAAELQARLIRAQALHALKRDADARAELTRVQDGLVRYASVNLQLRIRETELALLQGDQARASYQQANALLARLPRYARAFAIHQLAASNPGLKVADAAKAGERARTALAELLSETPTERHAALLDYARTLGLEGVQ